MNVMTESGACYDPSVGPIIEFECLDGSSEIVLLRSIESVSRHLEVDILCVRALFMLYLRRDVRPADWNKRDGEQPPQTVITDLVGDYFEVSKWVREIQLEDRASHPNGG